jgi:hypothetical protein
MPPLKLVDNLIRHAGTLCDASRIANVRVLTSLAGPALRGLILQRGKAAQGTDLPARGQAHFDWSYTRDRAELARLYERAKGSQWDATSTLDWSANVDPHDRECEIFPDEAAPLCEIHSYRTLPESRRDLQRRDLLAWLLSQFLHGEQGALFAACQVTQAVSWMDGKLYGSTQVVDEGRHVEVFHRYLAEKLAKLYAINDNLYVIIDALMTDGRWDVKFLGMQIMIEGLALGAFGTLRATTREPLLRELLRYVIADEARHVHFGVLALREHIACALSPAERREREDWAFEMALLMRNRFLAHEFYDEHYGHLMSRRAWERIILGSRFMDLFRKTLFRRIVPNLKRIGLLSERIRPHYAGVGVLEWENEPAAPDLDVATLGGE